MSRSGKSDRTLYVGNLPGDIREREVEDLFYKYGSIVHVELKVPPRPPGYAFVEFEDVRDAEDAIRGRDGYDFDGHRLRVELAHGGRGNSSTDRHSSHSSSSRGPRGGVSRRSDYRVLITGLPHSASWQDLKDHMRRAGDVCFSQVFNEGSGKTGIADYTNQDDMKYALKKLDDSEFRNAFSRARIHVKEYDSTRSRSRSRSRSPSYLKGKSNGRGRSASRSNSRSKSKSPKRKASRHSRSRSKSVSSRSRSGSKGHPVSRSPSRSRSPKPSVSLSSSRVNGCLFVFLYLCSWTVIKRLVLFCHRILVFAFPCLFLTSFSTRNMQVRVQKDAVQAEAKAGAPARVVAGVFLGERLADLMNVNAVILIN